eukprot:COSAG04_NODE_817_length_10082_cov_2.657418_10_plen_137_part_00
MASLTSSLNPVHGEGDAGGESADRHVPLPDYFGAFATKLLPAEGDAEAGGKGGKGRRLTRLGRVVRATLIVPPSLLLLLLPGALKNGNVVESCIFEGVAGVGVGRSVVSSCVFERGLTVALLTGPANHVAPATLPH